jgi:hypothetical protein
MNCSIAAAPGILQASLLAICSELMGQLGISSYQIPTVCHACSIQPGMLNTYHLEFCLLVAPAGHTQQTARGNTAG